MKQESLEIKVSVTQQKLNVVTCCQTGNCGSEHGTSYFATHQKVYRSRKNRNNEVYPPISFMSTLLTQWDVFNSCFFVVVVVQKLSYRFFLRTRHYSECFMHITHLIPTANL